jgi:hypothetical protein
VSISAGDNGGLEIDGVDQEPPLYGTAAGPRKKKSCETDDFCGLAYALGLPAAASGIAEERLDQVVIRKARELTVIELAPLGLGRGIALEPHRAVLRFERRWTEWDEVAASGEPAGDLHDEVAKLSSGWVNDESSELAKGEATRVADLEVPQVSIRTEHCRRIEVTKGCRCSTHDVPRYHQLRQRQCHQDSENFADFGGIGSFVESFKRRAA